MSVNHGLSSLSSIYNGISEMQKVYYGNILVYEKASQGGIGLFNGVNTIAYSVETYGCDGENSLSVSNVVPSVTQSGDMIVVCMFARSAVTAPSGFTLAVSENNPNTTTGQFSAIYYKVSNGSEAGSTLTFTQASASSICMSVIVLRSSTGGVLLDTTGSNGISSYMTEYPNINASANGSVSVYVGSVTFNSNVGNIGSSNFNIAKSYNQTTSGHELDPDNNYSNYDPYCDDDGAGALRMVAGYKYVNSGATGTSDISDYYRLGASTRLAQCLAVFKPSVAVSAPIFPSSYTIFHGDGVSYGNQTLSNFTTINGDIQSSISYSSSSNFVFRTPSTISRDIDIANPPTISLQLYSGKILKAVRIYNYIILHFFYGDFLGYYYMFESPYKYDIEASSDGVNWINLKSVDLGFRIVKKTYDDTTVTTVTKSGTSTYRQPIKNYIEIPIDNDTSYGHYRIKFLRGESMSVQKDGISWNGFYIKGVSFLE